MALVTYLENAMKDLRLFAFFWLLLSVYRLIFMLGMESFAEDNAFNEEGFAAFAIGGALSLKTAGLVALFGFAFQTLPSTLLIGFKKKIPKVVGTLREKFGAVFIFMFTLLFIGRFPYYKVFGATYDRQVFMGLNDDVVSVVTMLFDEYGLHWFLLLDLALTYGLFKFMKKFLKLSNCELKLQNKVSELSINKKITVAVALAAFTFMFGMFARFGGAFSYAKGVNWENACNLKDKFLNECILDDGQALYRAWSMEVRMKDGEIIGVYPASINEFVNGANVETADDLTPYLTRYSKGAKIEKPEHIFIIVGETFAAWPLFEEYASIGAGKYIKELSKEDNALFYPLAMPNGEYTAVALTGFMTGILDMNVRVNYQPKSFEKPYVTAIAPQFKKLGYKTKFWYGGTLSWDSMGDLAKAQGFDAAYGYPEFGGKKQNTWGTTDEQLFNAIYKNLETSEPAIHLIMTTSNHPPFNMDLSKDGINPAEIEAKLASFPNVKDAKNLATELSYYNYMDKQIYNFIKQTYAKYPKSLFVVTGDHSIRMLMSVKPTDAEKVAVPLLFYGYGVNPTLLPKTAIPMHASVAPTLIELISPANTEYYSIVPSLFERTNFALMDKYYYDGDEVEELYEETSSGEAAYESFKLKTISWWLVSK
ncbi:MAG: sulfatase-like hydrolase/transferase [Selenomonadaceae bacterium]|nr:sulfatase-like hydrolase/transferase [Selenomonadaceae bacterium]